MICCHKTILCVCVCARICAYIAQLFKRVLPHFFLVFFSSLFCRFIFIFIAGVSHSCQWTACVFHFSCYFRSKDQIDIYVNCVVVRSRTHNVSDGFFSTHDIIRWLWLWLSVYNFPLYIDVAVSLINEIYFT